MGNMYGNKVGLAGEFRVMSELLLRGHNPAKSYLDSGADIVLENGYKLEVKSGHRCHSHVVGKSWATRNNYQFSFTSGARKKPQNLDDCDFIILWCMDDDCFLIIPKGEITGKSVGIHHLSPKFKYYKYKDRWDLLE